MAARQGALDWGIALAFAMGGTLIAVNWFRLPVVSARPVRAEPKTVVFTRLSTSDAMLLDKAPLFLPTKWNASQNEVKMPDASGALTPYPAKFTFANSELKLENLPVAVVAPATPAEALAIPPPGPLFGGLGRMDTRLDPLSKRGGYVNVMAASSGKRILGEALLTANPPGGGGWQALEFLASIDSVGVVSLNLTTRSGVEEVDSYFRRFLTQTFRIGARLPPGSYRVSVGP